MFTWICPQCGREVPPSYNECPDCAAKGKGQTAVATEPPVVAQAPPEPARPPAPAPRTSRATKGSPTGLMLLIFIIAFAGGAGAYWAVEHLKGTSQAVAPSISFERPGARGKAKPSALQRFIEITGIRLTQDAKRNIQARFLLVNHSQADMADLAANVTIWARTARSDEESVGTFSFKVPSLGPYEAKEMTAPFKTKLKIYELPDWQNVTADVQITSPQ
jgi:hypothetical protein